MGQGNISMKTYLKDLFPHIFLLLSGRKVKDLSWWFKEGGNEDIGIQRFNVTLGSECKSEPKSGLRFKLTSVEVAVFVSLSQMTPILPISPLLSPWPFCELQRHHRDHRLIFIQETIGEKSLGDLPWGLRDLEFWRVWVESESKRKIPFPMIKENL